MGLHIGRPVGHLRFKRTLVCSKQRPAGFLKARLMARDGGHEFVTCGAALAYTVLHSRRAAGHFHQFSQCHRGTAGLPAQPVPMAWQQGHLPRHDAQPGATRAARWAGADIAASRWVFRVHGRDIGEVRPALRLQRHPGGKLVGGAAPVQLCWASACSQPASARPKCPWRYSPVMARRQPAATPSRWSKAPRR